MTPMVYRRSLAEVAAGAVRGLAVRLLEIADVLDAGHGRIATCPDLIPDSLLVDRR